MPVDGSGNFTRAYSWVADKTGGVKIIASRMDGEFDNYASALNQVFWRSGLVSMTGNLPMGGNTILGLGNGSAGTPATRFAADTASGLYLIDVARVGLSAGGNQRLEANGTGVLVNGTLGVSGDTTLSGTVNLGAIIRTGVGVSTGLAGVEIGTDRSGNGVAFIDLCAQAGADYNSRMLREGGANGNLYLTNSGTGAYYVTQEGAAPIVFNTSAAERMRIDASGNLGIGINSPGYRLHVNGFVGITDGTSTIRFANSGGIGLVSTVTNHPLGFQTNDTERMRILANGDVGIGTSTPGSKLDVNGSLNVSSISELRGTVRIGTTGHGNIGSDTNTLYLRGDNIAWQNGAATDTRAYLNNAGNFGIGRGAPAAKLDVNGSVATFDGGFLYTPYNASTNTGTVRAGIQFDGASQAVNLYTSDTYRGGISNVGNWGIGQGPGSQRLSVNGGVVAGAYYAGAGQGVWFSGAGLFTCGVASNGTGNQLDLYTSNTARFSINSDGGITSSNLADAVGYKGVPQNAQGGAYTLVMADQGKHVLLSSGSVVAVTVPPNSSVAFPIGAVITLINDTGAAKTVTQGAGVTLVWGGVGTVGNRTMGTGSVASLIKIGTDKWYVNGSGLS
jgi:hypothetical protein